MITKTEQWTRLNVRLRQFIFLTQSLIVQILRSYKVIRLRLNLWYVAFAIRFVCIENRNLAFRVTKN